MIRTFILITVLLFTTLADAQRKPLRGITTGPIKPSNLSLKQEVEHAIVKGVRWLEEQQSNDGLWGEEEYPALTAMAVSVIINDPTRDSSDPLPPGVDKGLQFILSKQQSDGGIYGKGLASYNTSISMMTLMQANRSEFDSVIKKARRFLINQQSDFDARGKADNTFDGGIGYSFSAIEELPAIAGVPELSANRMGYGLGFSSNIMLSDRASLSLGWKYIGTIGKSSPYEPINAYLVEIGTKLYF